MLKFCVFIILALAVVSCQNIPQTTVSIHVEGVQDNMQASVITKDSVYTVLPDSMGNAVMTLAADLKPSYATFKCNRIQVPIYVDPGKNFEIFLKIDGWDVDILFTGEGGKKNEYLNSESLRGYYPDFKLDEAGLLAALNQQEVKFYATLDSFGFDNQFTQSEKKKIHYMVYSYLPNYPSYRIHRLMDKEYIPTNEFYNQLKDAIPEEETLLEIPEYHDAIVNMVNMYARQNMTDNDVWTYTRNRLNYIAKNIVNPVISSFLVDKFVTQYVGDNGTDHLDEIAPIYNAKVTCPEKKAKFDELCSQWIKITPGQPSPSFKYPDINGQDISLSDLAGKYVYIDVWATWCGPCQEELPHLKELEHKYKDKNIHFVSLSCDKNKATWEKMVKDDKLGGIQLHCGGDKTFSKAYIIRGIPRFILLDREGKIIEANMSRPSDPVTDRVLGDLAGI